MAEPGPWQRSPRCDAGHAVKPSECDVAVVGGGLVGVAAALGLQQQGYRVRLIERGAAPRARDDYDVRVYAVSAATQRFLGRLGVWQSIIDRRVSPYRRMHIWERDVADGIGFDAADIHAPTLGHIVESGVMLNALWQALPANLAQTDTTVTDVRVDDTGVRLHLSDRSELNAALLVIAEGRESALRERAGFELTSGDYPQTAVVCHVQTEAAHQQTCWQRFLPTGPLAFLPLADGRCSIVWSTTEAEELLQLDDVTFSVRLGAASQHVLGRILSVTPRLRFGLGLRHANHYVSERMALIGDAAHVVHPLAGQGVNLGLADAEALVRVLAEPPPSDPGRLRRLKRYERSRRADVTEMIAVTDALYRAYALDMPGLSALRGLGFRAVAALPPLRRQLIRRAAGLN